MENAETDNDEPMIYITVMGKGVLVYSFHETVEVPESIANDKKKIAQYLHDEYLYGAETNVGCSDAGHDIAGEPHLHLCEIVNVEIEDQSKFG